eukprot:GILJ01010657.1.p1 GENE.GILJ01010657.1~~GILJ01010657.1.p1  ORF type:complete len:245 (-),score=57.90 GILJ01010657.1:760-1494(-)
MSKRKATTDVPIPKKMPKWFGILWPYLEASEKRSFKKTENAVENNWESFAGTYKAPPRKPRTTKDPSEQFGDALTKFQKQIDKLPDTEVGQVTEKIKGGLENLDVKIRDQLAAALHPDVLKTPYFEEGDVAASSSSSSSSSSSRPAKKARHHNYHNQYQITIDPKTVHEVESKFEQVRLLAAQNEDVIRVVDELYATTKDIFANRLDSVEEEEEANEGDDNGQDRDQQQEEEGDDNVVSDHGDE